MEKHSGENNSSVNEIVELKEENAKLEAENRRLKTMLDNLDCGVAVVKDKSVVYANPALSAVTGFSPKEFAGMNPYEKIMDLDHHQVSANIKKIFEEDTPLEMCLRYEAPGNLAKSMKTSLKKIDWDGEPAIFQTVEDITFKEERERNLLDSKNQTTLILESINELAALLDPDLNMLWVNKSVAENLNINKENLIGKKCYTFWSCDDKPCPDCPVVKARDSKKREESLIETPDGRIWRLKGIPVFDEKGEVAQIIELGEDVTEETQARKKFIEHEKQFRQILDAFPDPVVIHTQGKIVFVNQAAMRAIKADATEDLLGQNVINFVAPEQREDVAKRMAELSEIGSATEAIEQRIYDLNGDFVDMEVKGIAVEYDGKPSILVALKDLTEKKEAEQAALEAGRRFKQILEGTSDVVYRRNLKTNAYDYISDSAEKMFGYTKDEFLNISIDRFDKVIHKDDLSRVNDYILDLINNGENAKRFKIEYRIVCKSGSIRCVSDSNTIINDENGKPSYILGVLKDITNLKAYEAALEESEERFKYAIDSTEEAIWDYDAEANHTYRSPQYFKMLGYEENEVEPTVEGWKNLVHKDDLDETLRKMEAYLDDKNSPISEAEFRMRTKDGKWKWILARGKVVARNELGRPVRIVGTHRDIDKRKKFEFELQSAIEAKDRLFSIIAHDLRSPIAGFLGLTKMLSSEIEEMQIADIFEISGALHVSAKNLSLLLENLLDWSKTQTGLYTFKPKHFDFVESLNRVIEQKKSLIKRKQISFKTNTPEKIEIFADERMIETIVRNLLSNALKFTEPGGNIIISAKDSVKTLEFSVEDDGVGMKKEEVAKLFSLEDSFSKRGVDGEIGSGVGLILSKELAQKHNGEIHIESSPGVGSKFTVVLPKIAIKH